MAQTETGTNRPLEQSVADLQQAVGELQRKETGTAGAPTGVVIGAGSDPLVMGLPVFCIGYLLLGVVSVGALPPTAMGIIVPVLLIATAFFQFLAAVWAIILGESLVASTYSLFSGFSASFAFVLLGTLHHWWKIPAADLTRAEALFFGCWCVVFIALTWIMFTLPIIYGALMIFIDASLGLAAGWAATGNSFFLTCSGAAILAFTFLGFWAWLSTASVAGGRAPRPPLGPPLRRPVG
ncbi:MAG TPA: GPR1/FUN34/YaaH family transporter [Acidimicrobiales bacterium]|nr:GPR1/FUN34/YaaH family transporter [Acidimicrobiales bacterium]